MNATLRSSIIAAFTIAAGAAQAAGMTVFKQPNFTGASLTLHGQAGDLSAAGFQDQVSSVRVDSGRWEVCTQPNFQGQCSVLEQGDYPTLQQALNHRIESARQVARYASNAPTDDRAEPHYGPPAENRWHGERRDSRVGNGFQDDTRSAYYGRPDWRDREGR
jgi:hypothetical protein